MSATTKPPETPPETPPVAADASLKRRAVRGGTLFLVVRLGTQVFQWAVTLCVARILEPNDYGMMTAGTLFVGLADMLAEAGMAKALIQKKDLTHADATQAFTLSLILSTSLYLLLFVLAGPIEAYRGEGWVGFASFLRVLALVLFFIPFRSVPSALLDRDLRLGKQSAVNVGTAFVQAALVLSLAQAGFGYWALAGGTLASRLMEAVGVGIAARWRPRLAWPSRAAWGLLRFGIHVSGSSLLWFIYLNADYAVTTALFDQETLGYYALAFQLISLPVQKLSANVNQVMYAVFCKMQNDRERIRSWFLRLTVLMTFVAAPALAGMALVADDGLPLLLGPRWGPAILPFQLLCPVGVLMVIASALHQTFAALGRPDITLKYNAACAVLFPTGFYLAGSEWGLVGICYAWLVLYPLLLGVLIHGTRGITGLTLHTLLRVQLPVLGGVAVLALAVFAVGRVLNDAHPVLRLALMIATGAATYAGWMLLTARHTVLADLRTLWRELRGG